MYYKVKDETISDIAEAIRTKNGVEGEIKVEDFAPSILALETGENTDAAAKSADEAKASSISAESSAQAAADSAGAAAKSSIEAKESLEIIEAREERAVISEGKANESRLIAESWAVGTRDGVEVTSEDMAYQNNAKYWADMASDIVNFGEYTDSEIQDIWDNIFQQGGV